MVVRFAVVAGVAEVRGSWVRARPPRAAAGRCEQPGIREALEELVTTGADESPLRAKDGTLVRDAKPDRIAAHIFEDIANAIPIILDVGDEIVRETLHDIETSTIEDRANVAAETLCPIPGACNVNVQPQDLGPI